MKIKSIKVIKGKNKWNDSKDKLIHMVLDLGEYEQKPSNKIDGFYERIKKYLPSMQSHRCSIGKAGGFFKRVKEGTWMGHIIEHVALELQTLAGYDTGWGRTRGVKGQKGVYNVVFNYEDEDKGKLAAREAYNVVNDIINDKNPQIDKIVKKLKSKTLKESIKKILSEEISAKEAYNEYDSIKTIVDGKRDVAFTTLENPTTKFLIFINGLKKIKVESEDETNYIVYKKRSEDLAKELLNIANKYGGKLRFDATEEDSRRIGQILNYNPKEIEDYILHNKKIRDLENNQSEEQIQESIRKILKEETIDITTILRRVHSYDLELEFEESLDMASNMLVNIHKKGRGIMGLKRFIVVTTSILMDGIHHYLISSLPFEYEWYDEVEKTLKEYYKDRIKTRYEELISEM